MPAVILCDRCGCPAWGSTREDAESGLFPDDGCDDCGENAWRVFDLDTSEMAEMGLEYDDDEIDDEDVFECPQCGAEIEGNFDADGDCLDCGEYVRRFVE